MLQALPAEATCNQIPGAVSSFRGALGSLDRPFAGPESFVTLRLSQSCDGASPGFSELPSDHVVTVVFEPPNGPRNVVVLASSCLALESEREACEARPEVGSVVCRTVRPGDVEIFERNGLRGLRFRFPDTDDLVGEPQDDQTLSGPATIAVTSRDTPLPCGLATSRCADLTGEIACVDELYRIDGSCDPNPHEQFRHFTALPPPNNYQGLCFDPPSICTATQSEVRFTIDADGNMLVPMDWRGVLLDPDLPPARLVRGQLAIEAFPNGGEPVRIPNGSFVRSFAPEGLLLAPIFQPQLGPEGDETTFLFGSADGPESVLWIARKRPGGRRCVGGNNDGLLCSSEADCDSECGAALFDFSTRFAEGVGPVLIPRFGPGVCQDSGDPCATDGECADSRCVQFRLSAEETVPLEGLIESPSVLITVVPEPIEGRDLNGDGDARDDVVLLMDRDTGQRQPIGAVDADGRAATRIHEAPFSFPAVASEDDFTAFLEAEPKQGYIDANGDGDVFDSILRVYRSRGEEAEELTARFVLTADAAPLINERSLVVSHGMVFFRRSEGEGARQTSRRVSVSSDGGEADGPSNRPSISADGRHVAFESSATNLAAGANGETTGYVHDLTSGVTVRLHVASDDVVQGSPLSTPALSGDGRYAAVSAVARDNEEHIFVLDRDADGDGIFDEVGGTRSDLIDRNPVTLEPGNGRSVFPSLSPDGRFVAYLSLAFDLKNGNNLIVPDFAQDQWRGWVTDRDRDGNGLFDELDPAYNKVSAETTGDSVFEPPAVSADGRSMAFSTFEGGLDGIDQNRVCNGGLSCPDVFVANLLSEDPFDVEVVSVNADGTSTANGVSLTTALSADARYVTFLSTANDLVPGDTNGVADAFLHDRQTKRTRRISVSSDGEPADGATFGRKLSLSADGRFVAFASTAGNLVPGDANFLCDNDFLGGADENCSDVFVHDRTTGFTRRVSNAVAGGDANGASGFPSLSADGFTVAFESTAGNLIENDTNDRCARNGSANANCSDIFVAAPDRKQVEEDLNNDGDLDDTLLAVLDLGVNNASPQVLAPASQVAVASGRAVFLSPESQYGSGFDLNGDGDFKDSVVHLFTQGSEVRNLGRAATAVALSSDWVAALVSETKQGELDLNGDGDHDDCVVHVASIDTPSQWRNLAQPADSIAVAGSFVAFTIPESDAGDDLNGDGDKDDRVVGLYNAAQAALVPFELAAEDLVLGPELLAFRTSEAGQGATDLNGDGDMLDTVLFVYDLVAGRLIATGQAATPCRFAVCDPHVPYRVVGRTVKFLTVEAAQGEDLNGDLDTDDVVLQTFDARSMPSDPLQLVANAIPTRLTATSMRAAVRTIGAVSAGVCTNNGLACATDDNCGDGGRCHVPPGACLVDLGRPCTLLPLGDTCERDEFCVPTGDAEAATCRQRLGSCSSDSDCEGESRCHDTGQSFRRLSSPFAASAAGEHVFVGSGRCVEDKGEPCTLLPDSGRACAAGETCRFGVGKSGTCVREHGSCRTEDDCPGIAVCEKRLILAAAADSDEDGVPDPFDNCPSVANSAQEDENGNEVGDACDVSITKATATMLVPTATATATVQSISTPTLFTPDEVPGQSNDDGCTMTSSADSPSTALWAAFLILLAARAASRARRRRSSQQAVEI